MYEPLWDELYERMTEDGKRIRGIWIADVAHQGESGVLNEKALGNDRPCTPLLGSSRYLQVLTFVNQPAGMTMRETSCL